MRAPNLLEVVTQLNDRGGIEHAGFIQDEPTMLERVDIALDKQQIRTTLDRKEPAPWNIDTVSYYADEQSVPWGRTI